MNVLFEERGTESSSILLKQIESGAVLGVVSVLVLAEISILFYREGNFDGGKKAVKLLEELPNLMWADLTTDAVDLCARLKINYKLSLADAIVLNPAIMPKADAFVTRDADFKNVDVIPIITPEDII
jgi:predicted nucleic acid-binding protein